VLAALLIGWILLAIPGIVSGESAGLYIALLSGGTILLALAITGTAMYLTLTIKAINLSRRQSNFIDSVTHELKSPIASLKLYLQTLNRRPLSAEEAAQFYKDMLEDVERLDQLINHLLDAARLAKDRIGPPPEDVELEPLLKTCAFDACLRYHKPPETVQLDLIPAAVHAARGDVEVILRNLIDNAVKYADDESPEVRVSLRTQPSVTGGPPKAVVRVSDNGPGIPLVQRGRIFGRFVRLGSVLEREKPGTGLGLYIARTMVARLGGKIRIRDNAAGEGTTFEVVLPAKPIEEPAVAEAEQAGQEMEKATPS
jgi:signal transduction histidine kinase